MSIEPDAPVTILPPPGHRFRVTLTGEVRHIVPDDTVRALCGADTQLGADADPARWPNACTYCTSRALGLTR
jgi:hypothetical protein